MGCTGSKSTETKDASKTGDYVPGQEPFILRLDYEFKDGDCTAKALEALRVAESFQPNHPGVIMYHFAFPDPENSPNSLEFIELYANEPTFWAHLSHDEIKEAADKAITPETTATNSIHAYGPGIKGKVKDLCMGSLSARQPGTLSGYVLREAAKLDSVSSPVYLQFQCEPAADKRTELIEALDKLHNSAHDGVIMYHVSSPYKVDGSDSLEVNEVCASCDDVMTHFTSEKSRDALKEIAGLCSSVKCLIYGEVSGEMVESISSAGINVTRRETAAGFIIHPSVDIKSQV